MTAIGALLLVGCAVILLGVATDRRWRWTSAPWWWVVVIATSVLGAGRFLGQGYRLAALVLAVLACAAGFCLRATIIARRRKRPARTRDSWERL
jgi:hypothetical protein